VGVGAASLRRVDFLAPECLALTRLSPPPAVDDERALLADGEEARLLAAAAVSPASFSDCDSVVPDATEARSLSPVA